MASSGSLLDYGIAINFFGNYKSEAQSVGSLTDRLTNSLMSMKNLVVGGAIAYGFSSFVTSLSHTALELESVYASLKTIFNSQERVNEHFNHAREFVVNNPIMDLEEIHHATMQLALNGLAKSAEQTDRNLKSIGDFASGKGIGLDRALQAAINAGNGNNQMLSNMGIQLNNLADISNNAHGYITRENGELVKKSEVMHEIAGRIKKAKKGTVEYKDAIFDFLGVLESGGMANASMTIGGTMKAFNNLWSIFKLEVVGASQVVGTLSNKIATGLRGVLDILLPRMHAIERIARGIGEVFIGFWGIAETQIMNLANAVAYWIDKVDEFFKDYENNVAPLILFIALVRIQTEEFLKGFLEGFKTAFTYFLGSIIQTYKLFGKLLDWLGVTSISAEKLGIILGGVVGILMGIKALRFATAPFNPLISGGTKVLKVLDKLIFRQRIFNGLARMKGGNISSGFTLLKGSMARLLPTLGMATAGSWAFTASLLANPITWVVVAVAGLVAGLGYLIYNWEEVGAKMRNVSDAGMLLLLIFAPIIGIPLLMARHWDSFQRIFFNIWRGVRGYLFASWLWIRAKVITPIKNAFSSLWDGITSGVTKFVDMVMTKFPFIKTIFEGIRDVWKSISEFFTTIWNKIADSSFISSLLSVAESFSGMFGDAGDDAGGRAVMEYASEQEQKDYFKKIAREKISGGTSNADNRTTVEVGGITIVQNAGENSEDFADRVATKLQNNISKQGK